MKKILLIIIVILFSCAAPKKCCGQDNIKDIFKFSTFYAAVNGGTSISDVETYSVTDGLGIETIQTPYDYCEGTWVGPIPQRISQLIMITDILGRPARIEKNKILFFIYRAGTVEKKFIK